MNNYKVLELLSNYLQFNNLYTRPTLNIKSSIKLYLK